MTEKEMKETIKAQQAQIDEQKKKNAELREAKEKSDLEWYRERCKRWDSEAECRSLKGSLKRKTAEVQRLRVSGGKDYSAKLEAEKARKKAEEEHKAVKQQADQLSKDLSDTQKDLAKKQAELLEEQTKHAKTQGTVKKLNRIRIKMNEIIAEQQELLDSLLPEE